MDEKLNNILEDVNHISNLVFKVKHINTLIKDNDNTDDCVECYKRIINELIFRIDERIEALYEKYSK